MRVNTLSTLDGTVTKDVADLIDTSQLSSQITSADTKQEMENLPTANLSEGQVFQVKGSSFTYENSEFVPDESLNIKAFGAKGDGTTDDTAAFQAAFTWAAGSGSGRELIIPAGRYILTDSIVVDGNQCNCNIRGVGSSISEIIWPTGATEAGFKFGATTPISRLYFSGLSLNTKMVSSNPALFVTCTGTGLKQFVMKDVIAYGDGLLGTPASGYFSGGFVLLRDAGQSLIQDCVFYGVDGSRENFLLIPSAVTIEAVNSMMLVPHLVNVSCSYVGFPFYVESFNVPGIEGVVFDRCNGFCVNGLKVTAQASDNLAYYAPQCNINNTQIEFFETGIDLNHIAAATITNSTLLHHPDSVTTGAGVFLTDVLKAVVENSYIEARPGTTLNGIRVGGSSESVIVTSNNMRIPTGYTGIIFEGASERCSQFLNKVEGGGELYANTSSQSSTNSAVPYQEATEISTTLDNGVVLKQGSRTVTVQANGEFSINWLSGFPNSLLGVTACSGDFAAYSGPIAIGVQNVTGFGGRAEGVSAGIDIRVNYTALGT
tara:strand:+ start:48637 stop:50271 length:1635 start_codon:yes stop_codon:yes gene_type:complete